MLIPDKNLPTILGIVSDLIIGYYDWKGPLKTFSRIAQNVGHGSPTSKSPCEGGAVKKYLFLASTLDQLN